MAAKTREFFCAGRTYTFFVCNALKAAVVFLAQRTNQLFFHLSQYILVKDGRWVVGIAACGKKSVVTNNKLYLISQNRPKSDAKFKNRSFARHFYAAVRKV